MARGILYGVGVGPGDPELITRKAERIIRTSPVLAVPEKGSGEKLALGIVGDLAQGKELLYCAAPMVRDEAVLDAAYEANADQVCAQLDQGKDVAFITLGDPTVYSTYLYLHRKVVGRGYEAEIIPGVPSFCAAAARLDATLVRWGAPLHVIPVGKGPVKPLLEQPGGKVLMKAGRGLPEIADALRATGQLERAALVEDCGLPGERVWTDWEHIPEDVGYFATVIVKEEP